MAESANRLVFLGAPGAGKGTQAKRLQGAGEQVLHISTGDMLRAQVQSGSALGEKAKTFMDAGELVPDDVMIAMVAERISQPDAGKAWILDGFPRTLAQAEALDRRLADDKKDLGAVVYFRVPEAVLVARLSSRWTCSKCGAIWNSETNPTSREDICDNCGGTLAQRPDDRPDAVRQRLVVYRTQTEPLLDYYRGRGVLQEIDADRSPDDVFTELQDLLNSANGSVA